MTNSRIFFLDDDKKRLMPMESTDYINEDQLQSFLATYPDLIPGDQIDPESPRRWLLVKREMGVPDMEGATGNRWSLDHLLLDQDGIPTFVEVKKAINTQARREVIAQMLDYAANGLAHWPVDRLRQDASETSMARGSDLDSVLSDLIGASDADSIEDYWQRVSENLRTGRVRLIFAIDKAPPELRRLAEFLNEKLIGIDVLIVELKQYLGENGIAIAPIVIGSTDTSRAQKQRPQSPTKTLNRGEFFKLCPKESVSVFERLLGLAQRSGYTISWNDKSWSSRIQRTSDRRMVSLALGWADNWNVVVYLSEFASMDPEKTQQIREILLGSGFFTQVKAHDYASVPNIDNRIEDKLIQVMQTVYGIARDIAEQAGIEVGAGTH